MTAKRRPPRRAGTPWRILVHEWLGGRRGDEPRYGTAHHITSNRLFGRPTQGNDPDTETSKTIELPGTEFDELVIGRWIHLEQKDSGVWWMWVGGVVIWVRADRDGRPTSVSVYGPGAYDDPVDGCNYELTWTDEAGR